MSEFPAKFAKKISPEFMDALEAMNEDEIKQRILSCEGNLKEIEEGAGKDEKLLAAKENVKEWSAPWRESKAMETAKIRFCLHVLEMRGISLSSSDDKK